VHTPPASRIISRPPVRKHLMTGSVPIRPANNLFRFVVVDARRSLFPFGLIECSRHAWDRRQHPVRRLVREPCLMVLQPKIFLLPTFPPITVSPPPRPAAFPSAGREFWRLPGEFAGERETEKLSARSPFVMAAFSLCFFADKRSGYTDFVRCPWPSCRRSGRPILVHTTAPGSGNL